MPRVNIFTLIHKGLRTLLYETASCLQQTDFTHDAETEAALDHLREALFLFEEHARHEDMHILPAVAAYEPSVADCFGQEHDTDAQLAAELSATADTFFLLPDAAARTEAGTALNVAFAEFVVFNLKHMACEERLLNELLWRYYSDTEILAIQQRIVLSQEPWTADLYWRWMLQGNNHPDTLRWFRAVAALAPAAVLEQLLRKAATVLPPTRAVALHQALAAAPVAA
ncbi:hemerythrin domain-containing protein [Flaviaesturariibacter amylovorans]|uniref:Hemerythrin-like domain-containing protein n=1 Tax=Flaviaesturariibacter amylovorans TaxID=1084520 RepID=A0ABP8GJ07_9BACT